MSKDSTQWERYFAEGHRGMGEGSAHSRRYGNTDDEGNAHSGGTFVCGQAGMGAGSAYAVCSFQGGWHNA